MQDLLATVSGLSDEDWDRQTGTADRWSIRDTVSHLLTGETSNLYIAKTVAEGGDPARPDFDLARWNRRNIEKSAGRSEKDLLAELARERAATLAYLAEMPEEALDRTGHRTTGETTTVEGVFYQIVRHVREHTAEIKAALST